MTNMERNAIKLKCDVTCSRNEPCYCGKWRKTRVGTAAARHTAALPKNLSDPETEKRGQGIF